MAPDHPIEIIAPMIRTTLLLLSVSLLAPAIASDPQPKAPVPVPTPSIYTKACQSLELQIKFSDDGGFGTAAHVRLDLQGTGLFKRQVLSARGYIREKPPALIPLESVKADQVRAWLQRLAVIETACRSETTKSEAFAKVSTKATSEETLRAFVKEHGLPGDRIELDIHIIATDGTSYHWQEGLDRHTQAADILLTEMSARPSFRVSAFASPHGRAANQTPGSGA